MPGGHAVDVQVNLVPDGFDSLASDNTAYLHLESARRLQVYAAADLGAYRHALEGMEGVTLAPEEGAARDITYDLVITDRPEDRDIAARTALYVGMVPDDLKDIVTVTKDGATPVDWDRSSPLLQYVELRDVAILDRPTSAEGVGTGDYEKRGYEVLVDGREGAAAAAARGRRAGPVRHALPHGPLDAAVPRGVPRAGLEPGARGHAAGGHSGGARRAHRRAGRHPRAAGRELHRDRAGRRAPHGDERGGRHPLRRPGAGGRASTP